MKKILIATNHYLPGYKAGGPIKSVSSICTNLQNDFDITVLTSNHDFGESEPYQDVLFDELINLDKYKAIYLSKIDFKNIKRSIDLVQPDIIYLNSFFSKMTQIVLLLKKLGIVKSKIILAPRGELSKGALSIKSKKKKLFLNISKVISLYPTDLIFHVTDEIEKQDIQSLFKKGVVLIPNLINLSLYTKNIEKKKGELKIIFLSRISSKKNLLFALKVLHEIDEENILFDIYGTQEDIEYWYKCEILIKNFKNVKVNYKGSLNPSEIPKVLSQYHLFFLPTLNENFGHAIVEAIQAGLIPLISDQTPWNDLEKYNAGRALKLSDKESFISAIKDTISMDNDSFKEISNNVIKYIEIKLDNNKSIEMYKKMFEDVVNKDEKL